MLTAIWNMINDGAFYSEPGSDFYTRRNPDRTKQRALDQLKKMGYNVTLSPVEIAVTG
jgi:transposase